MGWSYGFDKNWERDIGYGVPGLCDYPGCGAEIDRGLSYVCGSDPYGGAHGCGLFFCPDHLGYMDIDPHGHLEPNEPSAHCDAESIQICERCEAGQQPFELTPDVQKWIDWKLTDGSWAEWRQVNPDEVAILRGEI